MKACSCATKASGSAIAPNCCPPPLARRSKGCEKTLSCARHLAIPSTKVSSRPKPWNGAITANRFTNGNWIAIFRSFKASQAHFIEMGLRKRSIMRAHKPVATVFAHHNALIDHLAAQARDILVKCLEDGIYLFFVIEMSPLE